MRTKKYLTKKRKGKIKNTAIKAAKLTAIALAVSVVAVLAVTFATGAHATTTGRYIMDESKPPVYGENFTYDDKTRTGGAFIYR